MELIDKANILVEFIQDYSNDNDYDDFFIYNDLGLPIAICYVNNLIDFKNDGEELINETYSELCDLFNADENEDYESLEDLIG